MFLNIELSNEFLPDSPGKEGIKGVQPVMHVFVIIGLKQYPTMFCTHSECVGGLLGKEGKKLLIAIARLMFSLIREQEA